MEYAVSYVNAFCMGLRNVAEQMTTQGNCATLDSSGMCHLIPHWGEEEEGAFVYHGSLIPNKGLDNTLPATVNCIYVKSLQVTDDTLESSMADSNVIAWFRPELPVYKCPLLLSPLWQMPLWHQVTHATVIPSGIISLCTQF